MISARSRISFLSCCMCAWLSPSLDYALSTSLRPCYHNSLHESLDQGPHRSWNRVHFSLQPCWEAVFPAPMRWKLEQKPLSNAASTASLYGQILAFDTAQQRVTDTRAPLTARTADVHRGRVNSTASSAPIKTLPSGTRTNAETHIRLQMINLLLTLAPSKQTHSAKDWQWMNPIWKFTAKQH